MYISAIVGEKPENITNIYCTIIGPIVGNCAVLMLSGRGGRGGGVIALLNSDIVPMSIVIIYL